MILTIKNQTGSPLSYAQGVITVTANGTTVVPRDFNTILMGDATFLSNATDGTIIVNNGSTDLSGPSILILAQVFANFTTDPIATMPLYYSAPVSIRQSANTAANATVWTMRNAAASIKQIIIERINLTVSFDAGTPLGRALLRYDLCRFNTATPTGGSAITAVLADNLSPATSVTDIRFLDTGLTTTSVVFESAFASAGCPASDGSVAKYVRERMAFKLAAGEGLAIRLGTTAVTGQDLTGEITWSER